MLIHTIHTIHAHMDWNQYIHMQHTCIHIRTKHAIWIEFDCYTCIKHMHSYMHCTMMHIHHLISHICIFAPLFCLHVFACIFAYMCMYECCMSVCMCMYVCILHVCYEYLLTNTFACRKYMWYNKKQICTTYMHKHVTYIQKYSTNTCTYILYGLIYVYVWVCMMYISTIKRNNTTEIHAYTCNIPIFDIKYMSDTEFYVSVRVCLYHNCIAWVYSIHLYLHVSVSLYLHASVCTGKCLGIR